MEILIEMENSKAISETQAPTTIAFTHLAISKAKQFHHLMKNEKLIDDYLKI